MARIPNQYISDGISFIRRASSKDFLILLDDMELKEAILLFAMGIEKLFKGMLWDINPLLIYEDTTLKNLCVSMYGDKMTEWARNRLKPKNGEELPENKVHTGNKTIAAAVNFSKLADGKGPTLRELFRLRGILAHRSHLEYRPTEAQRFLMKYFYSLVVEIASELKLPDLNQFFAPGMLEKLKKQSELLINVDHKLEKRETYAKRHQAIWESRKYDPALIQSIKVETENEGLLSGVFEDQILPIKCPICAQTALLIIESVDVEGVENSLSEADYVIGLKCHYCDANITEPELVEEFELQMLLYLN